MRFKELLKEDQKQERFDFILTKMKENPELVNKIFRLVKDDIAKAEKQDPESMLQPQFTGKERDYTFKGVLKNFVIAINNTPGDFNDIEEFLKSYGKVSYIDVNTLMKDGYNGWDNWLQGQGNVQLDFIKQLYDNLFDITLNISGSNRGPGEVGLALLSPDIKFATVGDLDINGVEVEVKGEASSGGGRLKNSNTDFGTANLTKVYQQFNIPQENRPPDLPVGNAKTKRDNHFHDIAMYLEKLAEGAGTAYMKELFTATFKSGDQALINNIVNNWKNMNRLDVSTLAGKISYSNYANILKQKGFSKFLFLKSKGKKSLSFDVDDYEKHLDKFKIGNLAWTDKQNGPAVQVSML